ncbi:MAG: multidrug ABC transporter substrate-binding protein, partial [Gammaproteobacteria bacterium]|nr:multidrug ABC transporter substrate-binding protein [Gemmatimonadota bacterium]NIT89607.1 multidrug ABC transporter substrate-binding protein [Gemmatimonadota bacterium]NIU77426.1 multidrug ABC transporter substrate-binding protein [Gammaproteobacteria bacterium]NIX41736.1 multidrug ABC transporter substrate-binding protein [Gemmatimonadota bacterium]
LDLVPAVRRAVWSADPDLPVAQIRTMGDIRSRSMVRTSFSSVLLAVAAAMALLLGGVGVYGVVSYGVTQRTREMGVRIALGARRWGVIRLVVSRGFVIAIAGTVI